MKNYICQICGDAYLGKEKPKNCPFCGARESFIKEGKEVYPVVAQPCEISELTRKNLEETLDLELKANAIYLCMAGKTESYEIKAMYKRLAKVEMEHANIICKFMKKELPKANTETCSENELENFKKTIELEQHATEIYVKFAKESVEQPIKIMFTALAQAEKDHIELINSYLE